MIMNRKLFATALLLMAFPFLSMAQNKRNGIKARPKQLFTIEDLIPGGSTYYQNSVPPAKYTAWWGNECLHLELDRVTVIDKKAYDGKTLFTLNDINEALGSGTTLHHLYSVSFPSEHTEVLCSTYYNMYLVDWKQKKVVWSLPLDTAASATDFNETSRNLAFVKDHNLYVTNAEGKTSAVSTDGTFTLTYGESVHRDEFGISKGTFWSPDGSLLAFYRMDQSMVSAYPQVNISVPELSARTGAESPSRAAQLDPDPYPMAGETSHKVSVGIYNVKTGKTTYLQTGDPTDRYFTNIAWSPDAKTLYLIELNRDQNHGHLDAYDAETGKLLGTLFEERNSKYYEPLHPIEFLPWDASRFIYQTRKDGYNHIYLYSLKGTKAKLERQLTKGAFEVIDVAGFNEKDKSIIFTSNEANPIGCAIYSVNMKGKRTLLSDKEGWHTPRLNANGSFLMDSWSSPEVARRYEVIATNGSLRHQYDDIQEPWGQFAVPEMKVGTIKAADGVTDLYYRLVLPTDFDPSKKYPAIVYVYGGPHAHNIDASRHWGVRGWDVWMAQQGYVMFCLDNRGSEHRGLDFEQATFRQLGVEEMKDQMKGVEFLKSLPYVDGDRLGVHGWSFGGFMTVSLMTTYPDVFKVGVAGGPVIDWKYYEVMYGERYMDTPQTNPEGYAKTSCLNKADQLKGRLLIIYGGNDPTCVPQHSLSFIRACIDADTHPDLFTYPGDGHNMMGTDRVHLHKQISRYFDDFLK